MPRAARGGVGALPRARPHGPRRDARGGDQPDRVPRLDPPRGARARAPAAPDVRAEPSPAASDGDADDRREPAARSGRAAIQRDSRAFAEMTLDIRLTPGIDADGMRAELEALCAGGGAACPGAKVEWEPVNAVPPRHAGGRRPSRSSRRWCAASRGGRAAPEVRRRARLHRRHDPPDGARHPDRHVRARQPADSPPGERVRRRRRVVEAARIYVGLGSEVPRSVATRGRPRRATGRGSARSRLSRWSRTASAVIALRDPAGFAEQVPLLPRPLLDLVSLFDGEHSSPRSRRFSPAPRPGADGGADRGVVASLDDGGFLDSPRFAERRLAIEDAFRRSPVRAAAHAGGAYAGEAGALRRADRRVLRHADGPGAGAPGRAAERPQRRAADRAPHRLPPRRADLRVGVPGARGAARRRPLRDPRHVSRGHGPIRSR